jgi:hypothetical protein
MLELTVLPQVETKGNTLPWPPLDAALSILNVRFVVKNIY